MWVRELQMRDFRCYRGGRAIFGPGITLVSGPNGAGKTNLLEALYFGCTGRSCRTSNERELIRFGAGTTRVLVGVAGQDGSHELAVGFSVGQPKRITIDGAPVERLLDAEQRPLVSVFLPERLELIKGAPSLRRAHLDQLVAGLWPVRVGTRRAYAQALAQRNALVSRIRAGPATADTLVTWDRQLAAYGIALMTDRRAAAEAIAPLFSRIAGELGLDGEPSISYRPRSRATDADQLARELSDRAASDIERGFTGHGPHRDDVSITRGGRELRAYGSQGQQRLALLALLLAEREAIAAVRAAPPVMLLDDVTSELDADHRQALVDVLSASEGQAVITTTDLDHVPGAHAGDVTRILISDGTIAELEVAT